MYNNEIYPVNYQTDLYSNQAPNYDYYGMPPEQHYPIPCPEFPLPQPMPPVQPMPPMNLLPGMKIHCMMHLKEILEKIKNKKAALIIEGAKGNFDCVKVISVDDCTVVVETRNGICVIPLAGITAICMSKEVAEDVLKDMK